MSNQTTGHVLPYARIHQAVSEAAHTTGLRAFCLSFTAAQDKPKSHLTTFIAIDHKGHIVGNETPDYQQAQRECTEFSQPGGRVLTLVTDEAGTLVDVDPTLELDAQERSALVQHWKKQI